MRFRRHPRVRYAAGLERAIRAAEQPFALTAAVSVQRPQVDEAPSPLGTLRAGVAHVLDELR
jgi:hypothetical protein